MNFLTAVTDFALHSSLLLESSLNQSNYKDFVFTQAKFHHLQLLSQDNAIEPISLKQIKPNSRKNEWGKSPKNNN